MEVIQKLKLCYLISKKLLKIDNYVAEGEIIIYATLLVLLCDLVAFLNFSLILSLKFKLFLKTFKI